MRKNEVFKMDSNIPGVQIEALTLGSKVFIQIYNHKLNDSMYIVTVNKGIDGEQSIYAAMEKIKSKLTEEAYDKLAFVYLLSKYKLYKEKGWASNFEEFQNKFLGNMGIVEPAV